MPVAAQNSPILNSLPPVPLIVKPKYDFALSKVNKIPICIPRKIRFDQSQYILGFIVRNLLMNQLQKSFFLPVIEFLQNPS
jgi:hypothetical protein